MQLIKNNIGRIQSDRNLFETRSGPKQRRHRKIDVEDKKKYTRNEKIEPI
jgi:hypothetical protein